MRGRVLELGRRIHGSEASDQIVPKKYLQVVGAVRPHAIVVHDDDDGVGRLAGDDGFEVMAFVFQA